MPRHIRWLLWAVASSIAAITVSLVLRPDAAPVEPVEHLTETEIKQALFDVVQPIRLANCDLERFGEDNDGGYLMCGNLKAPPPPWTLDSPLIRVQENRGRFSGASALPTRRFASGA